MAHGNDYSLNLLRALEQSGAIREDVPHPDYWRFKVVDREIFEREADHELQLEEQKIGELRW